MLTLTMPAVRALGRHEPLGLGLVAGEDARGQALRHGVVERDRLVEVVVGQDVEQRGERLLLDHRRLLVDPDDRRPRVEGVRRLVLQRAPAAGDQLAALGARLGDGVVHGLVRPAVDQRADQGALGHRVADRQPVVRRRRAGR